MLTPKITLAVSSVVAAVVVSAGTGAVAGSLITGAQIKNGTITSKDVKDGSLKAADLKGGVAGPAGPSGPAGVSDYVVLTGTDTQTGEYSGLAVSLQCVDGRQVIGAIATFARRTSLAPGIQYYDDGTVVSTGIVDAGGPETLTLNVFCAKVS